MVLQLNFSRLKRHLYRQRAKFERFWPILDKIGLAGQIKNFGQDKFFSAEIGLAGQILAANLSC